MSIKPILLASALTVFAATPLSLTYAAPAAIATTAPAAPRAATITPPAAARNGQANPSNPSVGGQPPAASQSGALAAQGSAPGQVEVAPLPQGGPAQPSAAGAPLQSAVT